jgi:hypothetical protein
VDVTYCGIGLRGPEYYSWKLKKGGLAYEIGLCIKTGYIVWVAGPYAPGIYNDVMIFWIGMKLWLEDNERVEADKGYKGENPEYCKVYGPLYEDEERYNWMKKNVQTRHEHANLRIKMFECLNQRFRNSPECIRHHAACFRAVCVLTQLAFENGEPLWQPEYRMDGDE